MSKFNYLERNKMVLKSGATTIYPSLLPETFSHDVWLPGSPWPSESVRAHSRRLVSPGSGPLRLASLETWWALQMDREG